MDLFWLALKPEILFQNYQEKLIDSELLMQNVQMDFLNSRDETCVLGLKSFSYLIPHVPPGDW